MELKAIQLTAIWLKNSRKPFEPLIIKWRLRFCFVQMVREKLPFMRLLCDIQTPTSGKNYFGWEKHICTREKYRNLLGYLPQQFGYYPDFTAWDFLMYVAALKGLSEKQAHKKATELLEAVDLAEKKETSKSKLSLVV